MKLHFVSREEYRTKNTPEFIEKLQKELGQAYLIPEGGYSVLGMKGCADLVAEIVVLLISC